LVEVVGFGEAFSIAQRSTGRVLVGRRLRLRVLRQVPGLVRALPDDLVVNLHDHSTLGGRPLGASGVVTPRELLTIAPAQRLLATLMPDFAEGDRFRVVAAVPVDPARGGLLEGAYGAAEGADAQGVLDGVTRTTIEVRARIAGGGR